MAVNPTEYYDGRLLETGLGSFTITEQNDYFLNIANSRGMLITDVTEEFMVDYHKKLKMADFSKRTEEDIEIGFVSTTNNHSYRLNRDDQLNLLGEYVFTKEDETILSVYWKAEDVGGQIPHERDEFLAVVKEAFQHKKSTLYKLHLMRIDINAAVTHDEITAIKW